MTDLWSWGALLLLGAYHGINPGMGWLFAVGLGLQEKTRRAVFRALLPLAAGHALSMLLVVVIVVVAQASLPQQALRIGVAVTLFTFGLYRLVRVRHPRWGGMQVGFRDLAIWSFLMATAHGAGLMIVPVFLRQAEHSAHAHHGHAMPDAAVSSALLYGSGVAAHTLSYFLVMGGVAVIVYEKLGLALLRRAWINLDLIWVIGLMLAGIVTLVLPGH